MNLNYIDDLISASTQESQQLEFKRGAALAKTGGAPAELVKDVTAMANASGGRLIYGAAETKIGNVAAISGLEPVVDASITPEWIIQVVRSNSGPPLQAMEIIEIAVPVARGGGRILVVDVGEGATAHQSAFDHRYHQRVGRITAAMLDFQIRDTMNRRKSPIIKIHLRRDKLVFTGDLHQYGFTPVLSNTGVLSLAKWQLDVDLPMEVHADIFHANAMMNGVIYMPVSEGGQQFMRYRYLPSRVAQQFIDGIHPGQEISLGAEIGLPIIKAQVNHQIWTIVEEKKLPIRWSLYMPDALPIKGVTPFEEWCSF